MYKIGNRVIEVVDLKNNEDISRLKLFESNNSAYDILYRMHYVDDLSSYFLDNFIFESEQLLISKIGQHYRYFHRWNHEIYAVVDESDSIYDIYVEEFHFDLRYHPYLIPSLFSLERILIQQKELVYHSSYINFENHGIVFSAPSGGGKSTQAELWKKYKNATIVNGDKSILSLYDSPQIMGLPFSGSSEYCLNMNSPLSAIILLQKAPENHIEKMGFNAFSKILSQVVMNVWDEDYCNKIMDLVIEICSTIPIYTFYCTKEEDAVNYLYNTLLKDGVL